MQVFDFEIALAAATVPDYPAATALWALHGKSGLLGRIHISTPPTQTQLAHCPKGLRERLTWSDSAAWLDKLLQLEDPRPE